MIHQVPLPDHFSPYLPGWDNLAGAAGLVVVLFSLVCLGAALLPAREPPETKLIAGWGILCIVLTVWGIATPVDMRWPLALLGAVAFTIILVPRWRRRIGPMGAIGRILGITLPLWLVMLPLRASQIDTWLNLLPNAAYLFDHGMFPTSDRPPSFSFLPVAPYNTQFVAFAASVLSGGFAQGVMGLFNIALQCAAALLIARVITGPELGSPELGGPELGGPELAGPELGGPELDRAESGDNARLPPWWACALGFLIAVPLNPGFVPRVFFSSYGESPLAVTVVFAVWLAVRGLAALAKGVAWPSALWALSLVLAAMVNTKQSGLGLVLPVALSFLALAMLHPQIAKGRALTLGVALMLPCLLLYFIWRPFAQSSFPEGELKMLPVELWNWALLPGIFRGMAHAIFEKATFFLCEAAILLFAIGQVRRSPWTPRGMLIIMTAGVILLFTGFLLFTYIAHFPPVWALRAHSFFRYSSQLSLAIMLALTVALKPWARRWLANLASAARLNLGRGAILATLALPLLTLPILRFDLDAPQPALWNLGTAAAEYLEPDSRLALIVPGDVNDGAASTLSGILRFVPPRRRLPDLRTLSALTPTSLDELAADGYPLALVTCVPAGLADAPAGGAALLRQTAEGWRTVAAWSYPADLGKQRFSAMLTRGPVCQGEGGGSAR